MINKKFNIYKESQVLVIVLVVMSIVGIIVFALTSRVLRGMKESTERKVANTAYSEAMGTLDKSYNLFQKLDPNQVMPNDCGITGDKITCNFDSSQQGCGNSTVVIDYQNVIQKSDVKKDDVLEVNVSGYEGPSINITVDSGLGATLLVKTIGTDGGLSPSYTVLNEAMLSSWSANTPQTFQVSTISGFIPKVIRIRPLYSDATITVTGAGSYGLPKQQRSYTVTTTCGGGTEVQLQQN